MKKRSKYKPLLNDAWVYFLKHGVPPLFIKLTREQEEHYKQTFDFLPNHDWKLRGWINIPPYDFDGELKGIGLDVGSGTSETKMTGVIWQYDENGKPQPIFVNKDFKL